MPESVIAGDQMGVQSSGVSLISTVDCACGRARLEAMFKQTVTSIFTGPIAHLHIKVEASAVEIETAASYSQESSQRLRAPLGSWWWAGGATMRSVSCSIGRKVVRSGIIKCCAASLNGAAHFLVPLWRVNLNVPVRQSRSPFAGRSGVHQAQARRRCRISSFGINEMIYVPQLRIYYFCMVARIGHDFP